MSITRSPKRTNPIFCSFFTFFSFPPSDRIIILSASKSITKDGHLPNKSGWTFYFCVYWRLSYLPYLPADLDELRFQVNRYSSSNFHLPSFT
ncbi:hypothetical protein I312_102922 [Cryptococcus bacillisporus CA1280]|uniref:uncharacterized protein n=1 Tax=Cryptococcus bacillisporus CA1280 TaxID=1296109 RepID=UPI003365B95C